MKRVVWKYDVLEGGFAHQIPEGAEILGVQMQDYRGRGDAQIYALVDPDATMRKRQFMTVATGQEFKTDNCQLVYIDTFQVDGGSYLGALIFHVFEVKVL